MPEPRRTFAPVLGLGVAAGGLTAVAGNQTWLDYDDAATRAAMDPILGDSDAGQMPLAVALALVVLACWGVVLVSRGWFRRGVAVLGALVAVGVVAVVVSALFVLPDQQPQPMVATAPDTMSGLSWTGWYWVAVVGSVLSVVAAALAVRWVPHWPEMGSRYDAPTGTVEGPEATGEDQTSLDLWKSIDEGRDPTA